MSGSEVCDLSQATSGRHDTTYNQYIHVVVRWPERLVPTNLHFHLIGVRESERSSVQFV